MSAPLLQLANVTKSFGAVRAVRGVSLELWAGEVHALVGENGAGKSTLIKLITGAHSPDSGEIRIDGHLAHRLSPGSARAHGIAAIYQQPALFTELSVAENIALGTERPSLFRRVLWRERRTRARELLSRVGARIDPDTEVRRLSMPEQQLVEIARALGAGARVLVMDEPTAALTAAEVDLLLGLIEGLRRGGTGILYITHRLEEVFRIADRVTVLRDGETVGSGEPERVKAPEIVSRPPNPLKLPDLIRLMVGREVSSLFPPPENPPGGPMLQLRGVTCQVCGVRDVTLEVRAGEILGLAGLVGAGRTELARVLFGITPAEGGTIALNGREVRIDSPATAVQAGIGYVPEDRRRHGVILEMALAPNVTMAIHSRLFPHGWLRLRAEKILAEQYIRDLAIKTPSSETRAGNLSGGNQQKAALARWLAAGPKVLILDEPTQGVDIGAKAEIHKLIRRLAGQGLAVLMISSDLPEIIGMSDRIAVMRGGAITANYPGGADPHEIMAAALGQTRTACQRKEPGGRGAAKL